MKIKILLVDDHKIIRYGLNTLLEKQPDMEVVGEAQNGNQAVDLVKELSPDVVIMDVNMPNLNGIDATRQILKIAPLTKVIALSMYSESSYVEGMLGAGASGYLVKDCAFDEFIKAIIAVNSGKSFLSSSITDVIVKEFQIKQDSRKAESELLEMNELTSREGEVLQLIVEGYDPVQIAGSVN